MKRLILTAFLFSAVATLSGCGDGSSTSNTQASAGKTYYAVKYTNGSATSVNGPYSSLNSCQEFLASPSGHTSAWVGASCIESDTRPQQF